jgi:hypothetical protein
MANGKHRDSLVWGLILVALGILFLLDSLNVNIDVWRTLANFWPVILIVWGAWKLFLGLKEAGEARQPGAPDKVKK